MEKKDEKTKVEGQATSKEAAYDFNGHVRGKLGEFGSDEEYGAEFDRIHGEYGKMMDGGRKLAEAMKNDPRVGEFINAMTKGEPFEVALIKAGVTSDMLEVAEGEENFDKYKTAMDERNKKRQEREAREAEFNTNIAESAKVLEAFSEKNMKDNSEKADRFVEYVAGINQALNSAKWDEPTLVALYKGFEYDDKMDEKETEKAEAVKMAEVKGKNAKIEEKKKSEKKTTDGMPGGGAGAVVKKPVERKKGFLESLT